VRARPQGLYLSLSLYFRYLSLSLSHTLCVVPLFLDQYPVPPPLEVWPPHRADGISRIHPQVDLEEAMEAAEASETEASFLRKEVAALQQQVTPSRTVIALLTPTPSRTVTALLTPTPCE